MNEERTGKCLRGQITQCKNNKNDIDKRERIPNGAIKNGESNSPFHKNSYDKKLS